MRPRFEIVTIETRRSPCNRCLWIYADTGQELSVRFWVAGRIPTAENNGQEGASGTVDRAQAAAYIFQNVQ